MAQVHALGNLSLLVILASGLAVGFVLALFNVIGFGIPFIALVVAVICIWLFRRTVSR